MKIVSLTENLVYKDDEPAITVLLTTLTSNEIRIAMKKGQIMKEHKAPYPISVEIFEGMIDFGANGKKHRLERGNILVLDANVPHDLTCLEDCIVRLSISKKDAI